MSLKNSKQALGLSIMHLTDEINYLKSTRRGLLSRRPDSDAELELIMGLIRDFDVEIEKLSTSRVELKRSLDFLCRPLHDHNNPEDAAAEEYLRIQADFGNEE